MSEERIVLCYDVDTDNIVATYSVEAINDYQAMCMVAEHHPEIRTMDFDIMTKGIDI